MSASQPSLVVVGAGVGGYTAAIRAAREGMAVTLVESGEVGGTCLNLGCIPTKSLLHHAHMVRGAQAWRMFGLDPTSLRVDFAAVAASKDQAVAQLVQGVHTLVKRNRIRLVAGTAEFLDPHTVKLRETGELLRGERFVIATGSEPVLPRLPGIDLPGVVTSDGALGWTRLPASVLVIGGGVIGVEFAQIFSDLGSQVTIVEQQQALLLQEDPELVRVLQKQLVQGGVELRLHSVVEGLRAQGPGIEAAISSAQARSTLTADAVLVAVGRRPSTAGLGLERLGLRTDEGAVATDEFCRTALAHIYAVGDVRGGPLLAHKAGAEAECAVAHMLGERRPITASVIPRAVYTAPELAVVGLTEAEARRHYGAIKVGRFPFSASGKALTMGETQGLVKVVADAATDQILGIGMVGPDVTNLLGEATLAVQMELTLDAVAQTVHAHPTLTEALMEAAHDAGAGAIHLPPRVAVAAAP